MIVMNSFRYCIEFWPNWISTRGLIIQLALLKIEKTHVELYPIPRKQVFVKRHLRRIKFRPAVELWPHFRHPYSRECRRDRRKNINGMIMPRFHFHEWREQWNNDRANFFSGHTPLVCPFPSQSCHTFLHDSSPFLWQAWMFNPGLS